MTDNYFKNSHQHIMAEMERTDLLLQMRINMMRQIRDTDNEFRGLYLSDQDIDDLLKRPFGAPAWSHATQPSEVRQAHEKAAELAARIAALKAESLRQNVSLRFEDIAEFFNLNTFDRDVLLICLAPELDLRYERFFAWLQDDVTRKKPMVELVINLLCDTVEEKFSARRRFTPDAPLFKFQLLRMSDEPAGSDSYFLSKYLKIDPRVVSFLMETNESDDLLRDFIKLVTPETRFTDSDFSSEFLNRLQGLVLRDSQWLSPVYFYFQGTYGVGRQAVAESFCQTANSGMMVVDSRFLQNHPIGDLKNMIRRLAREAFFCKSVLFWKNFDVLLGADQELKLEIILTESVNWLQPGRITENSPPDGDQGVHIRTNGHACGRHPLQGGDRPTHKCIRWPQPIIFSGETPWEPANTPGNIPFIRIKFPTSTYNQRLAIWHKNLKNSASSELDNSLQTVASMFKFSSGQIQDAATTARNLSIRRNPENPTVTEEDLYKACRLQSNRNLGTLAKKIAPHYIWTDIVLPKDNIDQLEEICATVKNRSIVYEKWGFDRKLAMGKGLNALFAGPSGTGKTMAADIIAGELGLDLYKIDLSAIVSKYIGETEKNLSQIFIEAETSNAILLFDEADALYGKRSEVRDAHDRYANIEVSYLLQKMEEYTGIVILSTNFKKNLDEAFVRRMHFIVEFPFPEHSDRLKIWQKIWPEEAPCGHDIDLERISRFEITGGNIRNIALTSAFLAAQKREAIEMRHIIHATKREFNKIGKLINTVDFN